MSNYKTEVREEKLEKLARLYLRGVRTKKELMRAVGIGNLLTLNRYLAIIRDRWKRENEEFVKVLPVLILQELKEVERVVWGIANSSENDAVRVGALKTVIEILKEIREMFALDLKSSIEVGEKLKESDVSLEEIEEALKRYASEKFGVAKKKGKDGDESEK